MFLLKRSTTFVAIPGLSISTLFLLKVIVASSLFNDMGTAMRTSGWSVSEERYIMQPRESVTFEASYLFFKLGTVKFELLGKDVCYGVPSYRIRAFINSYSGIPFVNYHAVYETCADARDLTCLSTYNEKGEGAKKVRSDYIFNYVSKILTWEESVKGVVVKKVDMPLDTSYTDGLSFFYYVREACRMADGKRETLEIPIVSDTVRSSVTLTINERRGKCYVDAFDFPIEAERLSGHINFKGTFGVTGQFNGWISADSAEVPLRADLRVILGSIVVKLKSINRDDWTPPRAR